MKHIGRVISPDGKYKWFFLLAMVVIQLGAVFYISWRWYNISVDGIPYQWRCQPRLAESAFGTDYVRIVFPDNTAKWLDSTPPKKGSRIYVHISSDISGLMQIHGASAEKPGVGGDYMNAAVLSYENGFVRFSVAFDRYRIAPELTGGIYNLSSTDSVIASIRMKKGQGVIEGVFVNGIPLEECSDDAAVEAARKKKEQPQQNGILSALEKTRIVESGMVPPAAE